MTFGLTAVTVILRFGVFTGAVLFFTVLLMGSVPSALAPGAWYGGTAAVGPV